MPSPRDRPIALTMGEPAGIGPDLAIACWRHWREAGLPPFYVIADPAVLADRARRMGLSIPLVETTPDAAFDSYSRGLPVVPLGPVGPVQPGHPSPSTAAGVIAAIDTAIDHVRSGIAAAMVTNPIQKKTLYEAGFAHPGHTEYLAARAGELDETTYHPVMMLAGSELRVVPVTVHIPVARIALELTSELIVRTGEIVARDLATRFGIARPRLAVAGLNPHAGENGSIGREDEEVVRPAVETLVARGILAEGPLPADTMFHAAARARYDVALAMYHDQALIPAKTLGFDDTVNVTLGLPFVRTSPDHGTALDIAGSGVARPDSLIAALRLARQMAPRNTDAAIAGGKEAEARKTAI